MEKVLVMLSSYNGEKYIHNQIDSILNSKNVDVDILIRDDGSCDNTTNILKKYEDKYENISVYYGSNIGWKSSFINLIFNSGEYSYYAFSDQDDLWFEDKLSSAVQVIKNKNIDNSPILYYCNTTVIDEKFNIISKNHGGEVPDNHMMIITQNFCQGCTMVFNKALKDIITRHKIKYDFSHDVWIPILAYYFGQIIHDSNSYMYYIQHENNVLGSNKNIYKQFKNRIGINKSKDNHFYYALELKNGYYDIMNDEQKKCIDLITNKGFYNRIKLILSKDFKKFTVKGTLFLKLYSIFFKFD